jgi:hypothetical protein
MIETSLINSAKLYEIACKTSELFCYMNIDADTCTTTSSVFDLCFEVHWPESPSPCIRIEGSLAQARQISEMAAMELSDQIPAEDAFKEWFNIFCGQTATELLKPAGFSAKGFLPIKVDPRQSTPTPLVCCQALLAGHPLKIYFWVAQA